MAQGPASVDENIKINMYQLQTMKSQLDVVKEFKSSVDGGMKDFNSNLNNFGKNFSKSFSLKSLGSKISDTFSKGMKGLTSPIRNLGGKISGVFSGLKGKLSMLNPMNAMKSFGGKISGALGRTKK